MPSGDFTRPPARRRKLTKKKVAPKVATRAPVTDVQSSGPDYGTRKAKTFKKTLTYRKSLVAAKPSRQTDATSSSKSPGGGYGTRYSAAFTDYAKRQVALALDSKPFDPAGIKAGIDLGVAKDFRISSSGAVIHKHRRDLLPDEDIVLDPKRGGLAEIRTQMKEGASDTLSAGVHTGALAILHETARPFHAIAGLAQEGSHGFTEGLLHNRDYTFGKALKNAGVPSAVAGPLGFAIDVVADPTTYVSFGTVTLAKKAAEKAAVQAAKEAAKKGASRAAQTAAAREAAAKAVAAEGKGLRVKFGKFDVPGVTRSTATGGKVLKRVAAKAPEPVKSVGRGVRNAATDVRPQLRRAGEDEAEHVAVRQAGRQARAEAKAGMAQAERQARAIRKQIPKGEYERVIAAIEHGKISQLPKELRRPASHLRGLYREMRRIRERAGIGEGDVTKAAGREGAAVNYVPHVQADDLKKGLLPAESVPKTMTRGTRKVRLGSSMQRGDLRPIDVQNPARLAEGKSPISTNLPLVHADYAAGTARAVAMRNFGARLAEIGRPLKKDTDLRDGDAIFKVEDNELTRIEESKVPLHPETGEPVGRFVVLNERMVERELANIAPQVDRTAFGTLFDRGTAAFKRIATFTPGFHARNLVGDTQLAYLGQPGHRLVPNAFSAGRAVRRMGGIEKAQAKRLGPVAKDTRTLKLRREPKDTIKIQGEHVSLDKFLADAREHGVIRSGYIGRELEELRGIGKTRRVPTKAAAPRKALARWMQNREDWMRLATFKYGLDKGLTVKEAADLSTGIHIDYGDLTKFERTTMRRAMPFYTFTARALPVHVKTLVTRPGKYANIEKVREETAEATGVDLGLAEKKLKTFQARQAPLILKLPGVNGGKPIVVSDALPLTLLNELPTTGNVGGYIDELGQWMSSMVNPIFKDPVELYANRSFFFRNEISSKDTGGLVAAPAWAGDLYKQWPEMAAKLGIVPDFKDKRTGRKTWGWDGKSDYVFKSVPGLPNFIQQFMTEGANRRGQGTGAKVLSFVAGVRVEPLDPVGAALEVLFRKHDEIEKKANGYARREWTPRNARAAALLRRQQRLIERDIYKLSRKRGDETPLYRPTGGGGGPSPGGGLESGLGGSGLSG